MGKSSWGLVVLALIGAGGGPAADPAAAQAMPAPAMGGAQPAPAPQAAAGDPQYAAALKLLAEKKWPEAAAALEKFLAAYSKHPNILLARLRLGDALLAQDKSAPALAAYQAVTAEKPAPEVRAEALVGVARAQVALKADAKAIDALTEALEITEYNERLDPPAGMLLGEILFRLQRYGEAGKAFYRVTRWPLDPQAPRAYFMVGEAYRLQGNPLEAAVAFRNTADQHWRSPFAPRAALAAAEAFLALGKQEDAEKEYRRILQSHPNSAEEPRAQLGLAHIAYLQGNYPVARAGYQAAALLFPKAGIEAQAELRIADCYVAERNLPEARTRYAALTGSADRAVAREARYSLGLTYHREGQIAPAMDHFRKLASDREAGRWSHLGRLRLAECLSGGGDYLSAVSSLRSILAEQPEPAIREEATFSLGATLVERGDFIPAEAELNALLQAAPAGAYADRASILLAQCRLEQADAAGAVARVTALLKKELAAEPRAAALTTLGRAQLVLKQDAAGIASLKEVLEKHAAAPAAPEAACALLAHYQQKGLAAQATEIERLITTRYGGSVAVVDALLEQAVRQAQGGRYAEALGLFNQVLERRPNRAARLKARAGIAEASAALKKPADVEQQVAEITRDAPPPGFLARTQYRVALAYGRAGSPDPALVAYQAALGAEPGEDLAPAILLGLGRLLADRQQLGEAGRTFRDLAGKYPKSALCPEALYALAWCYLDEGRPEAARPVFVRLAGDYPAHSLAADALYRVAEQDFDAGNFSTAAERYRKAAESNTPVADEAGYKLGWALRQAGDHAGAAKVFAATAKRFPESDLALECRIRAGEACLELGQKDGALEQFQAALAMEPKSRAGRGLAVQASVGLARTLLLQGNADQARTLAEEAAAPANGWYGGLAQLIRAEALLLKDGPKAAVSEYLRGTALFARYKNIAAEAQYRAAECYEKLGNTRAAQAAWQRVLDVYPGTEWANRSRVKLGAESGGQASRESGREGGVPGPGS
jgi:TolA-binding protein